MNDRNPSRPPDSMRLPDDVADGVTPENSRYRILWPHARGGVGQVFVAEDTELHRQVALKEIQPEHIGDPSSRARFDIEAEVTGKLEHPGVVPVYSKGTHPDGRPFYTMRLIRGEDLKAAIRRLHAAGPVDFRGREFRWLLGRFLHVCEVVAYAHSKGFLHRDLKPSNIMLGPFGETLVVDWGLARSITPSTVSEGELAPISGAEFVLSSSPRDSATLIGQAVGTPAYMSPEQAAGRLDEMGPASDVYSLGVMLHVILMNRVPEPASPGREAGPGSHREPGDGGPNRRPGATQGSPDGPKLPDSLLAICRKARHTRASQRYQSALALANDLESWLADEPISARSDPWAERCRRWTRRNHSLVATLVAVIVVALLALGLAVPLLSLAWREEARARAAEQSQRLLAIHQAREADEQRAAARRSEREALQLKEHAEQALAFLVRAFRSPNTAINGRDLRVAELLGHAVKEVENGFAGAPTMQATVLGAIGETYAGLGLPHESLDVLHRAYVLRAEALGEDHPETLRSLNFLAAAHTEAGRADRAMPLYEEALQRRRATLGDDHPDTVESMNDLAEVCWSMGQHSRAIELYEATLAKEKARLGDDHVDTLTVMDNLAVAYSTSGQAPRAVLLHETALAGFRAQLGNDHPTTLVALNNLARACELAGRSDRALALLEEVLPRMQARLGHDHPTTLTAAANLARVLLARGRADRASVVLELVLARRRVKLGADHPGTLEVMLKLASAYHALGRDDRAAPLARLFLQQARPLKGRLPKDICSMFPEAEKLSSWKDDEGMKDRTK